MRTRHLFSLPTLVVVLTITAHAQFWRPINSGIGGADVAVLLADHDGNLFAGTECGIYRTTDDGEHWIHAELPEVGRIREMVMDSSGMIIAGSNFATYCTIDGGRSWQCLATFPTVDQTITPFAVTATGTWYGSGGGSLLHNLHKSTDGRRYWEPIDAGLPHDSPSEWNSNPGLSTLAMALAGNDLFVIVTAFTDHDPAHTLHRSSDGGATWVDITASLPSPIYLTAVASTSEGTLFVGSDSGAFMSTDHGVHWSEVLPNDWTRK